jgi:hypothetical protein
MDISLALLQGHFELEAYFGSCLPVLDKITHRAQKAVRNFFQIDDKSAFLNCLLDFIDACSVECLAASQILFDVLELHAELYAIAGIRAPDTICLLSGLASTGRCFAYRRGGGVNGIIDFHGLYLLLLTVISLTAVPWKTLGKFYLLRLIYKNSFFCTVEAWEGCCGSGETKGEQAGPIKRMATSMGYVE